jgi:hypothetical protein
MQSSEITITTSPANLALWYGTDIPARVTFSETTIAIRFESPPTESFIEQLQQQFAKIESHFSDNSLKIMQYLFTLPEGQASRNGLMEKVWGKTVPTFGAIRQAIRRLNTDLTKRHFGYTIRGSRNGIYRFIPIEK